MIWPPEKPMIPEKYKLAPNQIFGSPYSTSRQIQKEITGVLQGENALAFSSAMSADVDMRKSTDAQSANCELLFRTIQQAEHLERRDREVQKIISGHQNIDKHANVLGSQRTATAATTSAGGSGFKEPGAANAKQLKHQHLSTSQRNLMDIV